MSNCAPIAAPSATSAESPARVCAVVVTYNRCALLARCLDSLSQQGPRLSSIVVVDNASTDDTQNSMRCRVAERDSLLIYQRLAGNVGGAGGFAHGIASALSLGADWIWLMDDDAEPEPQALCELLAQAHSPRDVYASAPQRNGVLAWPATWRDADGAWHVARRLEELPPTCTVASHPFLGFLIHRDLVQRIGLPDATLFISADDIDYSLRARASGAEIVLIRASRINHPVAQAHERSFAGRRIVFLSLPPWRRYYDTRNRLLIARRHHGHRFWTQAIPGTLARIILILLGEPAKLQQLKAALAGLWDGCRGVAGPRHHRWHLDS